MCNSGVKFAARKGSRVGDWGVYGWSEGSVLRTHPVTADFEAWLPYFMPGTHRQNSEGVGHGVSSM